MKLIDVALLLGIVALAFGLVGLILWTKAGSAGSPMRHFFAITFSIFSILVNFWARLR